jgi:uncharacterized protein YcfJ
MPTNIGHLINALLNEVQQTLDLYAPQLHLDAHFAEPILDTLATDVLKTADAVMRQNLATAAAGTIGAAVGTAAGAALGTSVGGPLGATIGATAGGALGTAVGTVLGQGFTRIVEQFLAGELANTT